MMNTLRCAMQCKDNAREALWAARHQTRCNHKHCVCVYVDGCPGGETGLEVMWSAEPAGVVS